MNKVVREPPVSTFIRLFRHDAARLVEYSFGSEPGTYGIMVPSQGNHLPQRVGALSEAFGFTSEWRAMAERLVTRSTADFFYVRVDQEQGKFSQLSVYTRYAQPIQPEEWRRLEEAVAPIQWQGPVAFTLAEQLHVKGPQIVSLKIRSDRDPGLSLYFDTPIDRDRFEIDYLQNALVSWGWPLELAPVISSDMKALKPPGKIGWVSFKKDLRQSLRLKIDTPHVPIKQAELFIRSKGIGEQRLQEVLQIPVRLMLNKTNYFGLSYDDNGLVDWKLYFAFPWSRSTLF